MSRGDAVIDATAVYRVEANNSTPARHEPNFNRVKNLVKRELGFGKLVFDGSPGGGLTDSLAGSERHQLAIFWPIFSKVRFLGARFHRALQN